MPLIDKIKGHMPAAINGPVWAGPESNAANGGITFSLLSKFLVCRERFRCYVVEGLASRNTFNHRIEYGNMWHICEETLAGIGGPSEDSRTMSLVFSHLEDYANELSKRYPLQQEEIEKWYLVCQVQFPIYRKYWAEHPDVLKRTPLLQEYKFQVPYKLPSGRIVFLRGKWDSIDIVEENKQSYIWAQENKSKGEIDEAQLRKQLVADLQTMIYLTALYEARHTKPLLDLIPKGTKIAGIRYNVIRRPLSGGKGTIVRHKSTKNKPEETWEHYLDRLRQIIDGSGEDTPGPTHFFMRWNVEIGYQDLKRFQERCLNPILEQLCIWWDEVSRISNPFGGSNIHHYQFPYGVYSPLTDGGATDLDLYLQTGSDVGLRRTTTLFPELV